MRTKDRSYGNRQQDRERGARLLTEGIYVLICRSVIALTRL